MVVDLHVHTTASNGVWKPRDVFNYVRGYNIELFSITDHDVPQTIAVAPDLHERYIPGIEIETQLNEHTVHLLVYGHLHARSHLISHLARQRKRRMNRVLEMVLKLVDHGVVVTLGDVVLKSILAAARPGRLHVARALVRLGVVRNIDDAFDLYLSEGRLCYVPLLRLPVSQVVDLAHEAGGHVVVAHPLLLKDAADLHRLRRLGIDGVEAWHPSATRTQSKQLERYAYSHNLIVTAGSYCDHNVATPTPTPFELDEKAARLLKERRSANTPYFTTT